MTGEIIGIIVLIGIGYLIYKSIPPMDPELAAPIKEHIDWEAQGIAYSDLDARKAYLDKLYLKVKEDHIKVYRS